MSHKRWFDCLRWGTLISVMAWTTALAAQNPANRTAPPSNSETELLNSSLRELQEQVGELQAAMATMRSDWQQARAETAELRRELAELRSSAAPPNVVSANVVSANPAEQGDPPALQKPGSPKQPAASLEEEYQLLLAKVDDQYQTKVESASKYRLRISGIALLNLFSNQGVVDNIDFPMLAYPRPPGDSGGSFGATLRQSQIGFESFGPTVAGAKTKADLQLDLAGGFPSVPNGVNSGLMRLRTATLHMDWTNTSVVVGQDEIFFTPNSPTSFASLAVPALSAAGNLWAWVPQIRVEHKVPLGEQSSFLFQAGILDPVSGETPYAPYRQAGPGEESRQPAYATRIAWSRNIFGQPLRLGAGGYYSRQDYGFGQNVDGWAGTADFELPLTPQLSLRGAFYRGRALGGLYAAYGRSVLYSGEPGMQGTEVQALDSVGGWAQLKYRPVTKWEFNAAFGMDNPYASDLKYFPYAEAYGDQALAKNLGSFVNMIYRPRSDLLFSAEYRHLTTYSLTSSASNAGHLNLTMGVLF